MWLPWRIERKSLRTAVAAQCKKPRNFKERSDLYVPDPRHIRLLPCHKKGESKPVNPEIRGLAADRLAVTVIEQHRDDIRRTALLKALIDHVPKGARAVACCAASSSAACSSRRHLAKHAVAPLPQFCVVSSMSALARSELVRCALGHRAP
jgi:hypothetical protein